MRLGPYLIVLLACLGGCTAPARFATLEAVQGSRPPTNLALRPSAEDTRFATLLNGRSDWPSVDNGYRMEDVTSYATSTYDVQMQFDRHNSLYYEAQSVNTGVRVR
jgi:hypothetical protein